MTFSNKVLVNTRNARKELENIDGACTEYTPDVDFINTITFYSTMVNPYPTGSGYGDLKPLVLRQNQANAELISSYAMENPEEEPQFLFAVLNYLRGRQYSITVFYDVNNFRGFKRQTVIVSDFAIKGYNYIGESPLADFQVKTLRVLDTVNGKVTADKIDEQNEIATTQPYDSAIILGWGQDYLIPIFKHYGFNQIQ